MCYFITAVLPKGTRLTDAQAVAARFGRRLEPIHNPVVQRQLRTGETQCLTAAGHCDCGTSLGADSRSGAGRTRASEVRGRKLARRGWSAGKIERALRDSHRAAPRLQAVEERANWQRLLAALRAGGLPYLGILLHAYEGRVEGECIELLGRVRVPTDGALEALATMAENTLYEFRLADVASDLPRDA